MIPFICESIKSLMYTARSTSLTVHVPPAFISTSQHSINAPSYRIVCFLVPHLAGPSFGPTTHQTHISSLTYALRENTRILARLGSFIVVFRLSSSFWVGKSNGAYWMLDTFPTHPHDFYQLRTLEPGCCRRARLYFS